MSNSKRASNNFSFSVYKFFFFNKLKGNYTKGLSLIMFLDFFLASSKVSVIPAALNPDLMMALPSGDWRCWYISFITFACRGFSVDKRRSCIDVNVAIRIDFQSLNDRRCEIITEGFLFVLLERCIGR